MDTVFEGDDAAAWRGFAGFGQPAQHRAILLLEGGQLRKGFVQQQQLGVAGVDAGHEGVHSVVHDFGAEAAAEKVGHGFGYIEGPGGLEELLQQSPLGLQAEKAVGEQAGGRAGQLAVAPVAQHVAVLAHGGRVLHLVTQAEVGEQFFQLGT